MPRIEGKWMRKLRVKTGVELLNIIWPEFMEVSGAILRKDGPHAERAESMDLTGWEAFANHQHTLDLFRHQAYREGDTEDFYIPTHPDFKAACAFGKKLAEAWFRKLRADFPHYRFRVYYTEEDNPIVTFHRVRDGEPHWLSEDGHAQDIAQGKVIVFDSGQ
jgi:hypothetical protein